MVSLKAILTQLECDVKIKMCEPFKNSSLYVVFINFLNVKVESV